MHPPAFATMGTRLTPWRTEMPTDPVAQATADTAMEAAALLQVILRSLLAQSSPEIRARCVLDAETFIAGLSPGNQKSLGSVLARFREGLPQP